MDSTQAGPRPATRSAANLATNHNGPLRLISASYEARLEPTSIARSASLNGPYLLFHSEVSHRAVSTDSADVTMKQRTSTSFCTVVLTSLALTGCGPGSSGDTSDTGNTSEGGSSTQNSSTGTDSSDGDTDSGPGSSSTSASTSSSDAGSDSSGASDSASSTSETSTGDSSSESTSSTSDSGDSTTSDTGESTSDSSTDTTDTTSTTDTGETSDTGETTDGDTGDDQMGISAAYPDSLIYASPTEDRDDGYLAGRPTEGHGFHFKRRRIRALLSATDPMDCQILLPDPAHRSPSPSCYGPQLDFEGHPDAGMGEMDAGRLPGGDLGIWSSTAVNGQACAAAKLNSLMRDMGAKVDYGMLMGANLICVMNTSATALPAVDESVDMTSAVAASLAMRNPGLSLTNATLAREADDDGGRAVYHYTFEGSYTRPMDARMFDISTHMRHRQNESDHTDYSGQIWTQLGNVGEDMARNFAYSLEYVRAPDQPVKSRLLGAGYPEAAATIFDADGVLDVGGDWHGNMTQSVIELSPADGTMKTTVAWQAGTGDSHARVFNAWVQRGSTDADPRTGCGFFGYGTRFDKDGMTLSDNAIDRFICNWAGPGNNHDGLANYAQKQCMSAAMGAMYVPTTDNIAYAPVNDCDTNDDPGFGYKLPAEVMYTTTPITVDLVDLSSDADWATWTAPTWP